MKQKDIALILVVIFVSGVTSFFVSQFVFGSQDRNKTAEVVEEIRPEFSEPPAEYFNANSLNPTQLIIIGESTNPNPFNSNPQ